MKNQQNRDEYQNIKFSGYIHVHIVGIDLLPKNRFAKLKYNSYMDEPNFLFGSNHSFVDFSKHFLLDRFYCCNAETGDTI